MLLRFATVWATNETKVALVPPCREGITSTNPTEEKDAHVRRDEEQGLEHFEQFNNEEIPDP